MDVTNNNNLKIASENMTSSTALLMTDEIFKNPIQFSNYTDFPVGTYYVDVRGVCASMLETRLAVYQTLEYMKTVADYQFFLGQGFTNVAMWFYENLLYMAGGKPAPEEYYYFLYRLNEVSTVDISKPQDRLQEMQEIVMYDYLFDTEFNFDTFCKVAKCMLGFTMQQETMQSLLHYLTDYYRTNNREAVSGIIMRDVMDVNYHSFINYVVSRNQPLYLVDKAGGSLQFPCTVYVERSDWNGNNTIQSHLSFELYDRKFYIACYNRSLKIGDYIEFNAPLIYLECK